MFSSSQDGGVGRNLWLPHTTKRRITTNLKSINNQNHQKIKLHGTPTTKELKKKSTRTTRLVRRRTTQTNSEKLLKGSGPWGWGWLPSSVDCEGEADLRGKLRLREVAVDYRGCNSGRNSQSHTRVTRKVS